MRDALRFVPYGEGNSRGIVYFNDVKVGWADLAAPGMYVPNFAKNARTLKQCAMHLAKVEKQRAQRKAKAWVDLIADLRRTA